MMFTTKLPTLENFYKILCFGLYSSHVGFWAAAAFFITAFAAYKSHEAQQEAADAREEAEEKRQTMQEIQASKNRQQAVREARARRAELQAQAAGQGVQGSSGLGGAISSATSNLASNVSFQNTQTAFSRAIAGDMSDARQAQGEASTWQSIGSLSSTFIDTKQLSGSLQGGSGVANNPNYSGSGTLSIGTMRGGAWHPK